MATRCKECKRLVHAFNGTMVMLHNKLWLSIAPKEITLCDKCIEKKLGRSITVEDLKYSESRSVHSNGKIPVNSFYAEIHNLNY